MLLVTSIVVVEQNSEDLILTSDQSCEVETAEVSPSRNITSASLKLLSDITTPSLRAMQCRTTMVSGNSRITVYKQVDQASISSCAHNSESLVVCRSRVSTRHWIDTSRCLTKKQKSVPSTEACKGVQSSKQQPCFCSYSRYREIRETAPGLRITESVRRSTRVCTWSGYTTRLSHTCCT